MLRQFTVRERLSANRAPFYPHDNKVVNRFDDLEHAVYNARIIAETGIDVFVSEDNYAGEPSLKKGLPIKKIVRWQSWTTIEGGA